MLTFLSQSAVVYFPRGSMEQLVPMQLYFEPGVGVGGGGTGAGGVGVTGVGGVGVTGAGGAGGVTGVLPHCRTASTSSDRGGQVTARWWSQSPLGMPLGTLPVPDLVVAGWVGVGPERVNRTRRAHAAVFCAWRNQSRLQTREQYTERS